VPAERVGDEPVGGSGVTDLLVGLEFLQQQVGDGGAAVGVDDLVKADRLKDVLGQALAVLRLIVAVLGVHAEGVGGVGQ
jgi:hypothetical protein